MKNNDVMPMTTAAEGVRNWSFSRTPKSAIFGVLSALVKDSRQFKQLEMGLLKVVTVNLPLYKQL